MSIILNGTTGITTPALDSVAQFSSADMPAGSVLQVVSFQAGAVATGTTTMPVDDTIPQITEGNEYMTLAITPQSASSVLKIDVVAQLDTNASGVRSVALFQDSTANAIAAIFQGAFAAGASTTHSFTHIMPSGTTSITTFRVRAGLDNPNTMTFNGRGGSRIFGGVAASSITITEIAA